MNLKGNPNDRAIIDRLFGPGIYNAIEAHLSEASGTYCLLSHTRFGWVVSRAPALPGARARSQVYVIPSSTAILDIRPGECMSECRRGVYGARWVNALITSFMANDVLDKKRKEDRQPCITLLHPYKVMPIVQPPARTPRRRIIGRIATRRGVPPVQT